MLVRDVHDVVSLEFAKRSSSNTARGLFLFALIDLPGDFGGTHEVRKGMSFDADTANPEFLALDNRRAGSAKRIKHALSGGCGQTRTRWRVRKNEAIPIVRSTVVVPKLRAILRFVSDGDTDDSPLKSARAIR